MQNANLSVYGPVADAAAQKYGLDPTIFRNLIASESSWNPYAINPQTTKSGEQAIGIAQFLPSTAQSLGVDPLDPYSALDGAARYLSQLTAKYGLLGGVAAYKGSPNSPLALTQAAQVVGQSDMRGVSQAAESAANQTSKPKNNKSLWQYSWDDFKSAISDSLMGFTLGLVGILLIIFSVYMLTKRGGTDSVATVKQIAGV
jgi:soluble lytic murein transglycosylase-like protein